MASTFVTHFPHIWCIVHRATPSNAYHLRPILQMRTLKQRDEMIFQGHIAGRLGNLARTGKALSAKARNHFPGELALWPWPRPQPQPQPHLHAPMSYHPLSWALRMWKVPGGSGSGISTMFRILGCTLAKLCTRHLRLWLSQFILEQLYGRNQLKVVLICPRSQRLNEVELARPGVQASQSPRSNWPSKTQP